MRLTLDALVVLDAIDRHGSFAAAAETLHRVPSAITYAVQKLEEDLDVLLFDRSGHRALLTEAGRELLREGRRLLAAADEIEARTRRVATGYEVELRIAVDDIVPFAPLAPVLAEFYEEHCGTRLRLLTEVYGGTWDALYSDRADLAIGVPADGPVGGFGVRLIGEIRWQFVVSPRHPLASAPEPVPAQEILRHRAVSVADSSRTLAPRTAGLLSGQDVLTVPSLEAKIAAQVAGLGVGYLPRPIAQREVAAGRLVVKQVEDLRPNQQIFIAWRTANRGKALEWFLKRLEDPALLSALLG
jgi:DNA-binding transcriptional LysR family regulator